jgi:hypothetical protein
MAFCMLAVFGLGSGINNIASAATGASATLSFSYPNGFANSSGAIREAYESVLSGSTIELTVGAVQHQAGGAWYTTQQNIQSFTTTFTFQIPVPSTKASIQGITFVVQNSNATTNPGTGGGTNSTADANLLGYFGYDNPPTTAIANSVAVKFDLNPYSNQSYSSTVPPNSTGLYINGGPEGAAYPANDLNPYGINLYSGHVFSSTIVYDGSILTMTILDTTTGAQARYTWPVNIPAATKGNMAYVGFTGGQVEVGGYQYLLSWSFWQGYNPRLATPTFSVTPGQYPSSQTVSISGPAGATIYYTTNGLLPTSASQKYTGPITVSASEVINAVAIQAGFTDSYVATGNYQIAATGTPIINFPSGFAGASNLVKLIGYPYFNGSSIRMTDANGTGGPWNNPGFELGSAWYAAPVPVSTFKTQFNLQFTGSNSNGAYGLGTTFCIQNQPAATSSPAQFSYVSGGPLTIGNGSSALGYGPPTDANAGTTGGLASSLAIKFDLSHNSTGLYTNGAIPTSAGEVAITGVNLSAGNPLAVVLSYNGTTLTMTVTDTVTHGTFTNNWTINIPSVVGGNTAYVGFTAATSYWWANQDIQSWTYSSTLGQTSAVPQAPTNLRVQ